MSKFFKLFLIYVLGVIGVFSTYNVAEAHSASFNGPADRIRKYKNFNYTFNKNGDKYYNSGFHCTPEKVRHDFEGVFSDEDKSFVEKFFGTSAVATTEIADVVATPLICSAIVKSMVKWGVSSSLLTASVASIFGTAFEGLYDKYVTETDFGLDLANPMCLPITVPLLGSCLATTILLNTNINAAYKAIVFSALVTIYTAVKNIYGTVQLERAKNVFDNIKICGEEWYTYGNSELQDKILNDSGNYLSNKNEIKENYIREYYPTKGVFAGSYKYYLDRCINLRDVDSCNKINFILTDETYFTEKNKIFREYKYGGMEYSYSSCNDPRPEARSYDVNMKNNTINVPQLYYSSGSNGINFACERFLEKTEWYDDYKCCVNASKRLLCVEYNKNSENKYHTFCDKDSDCYFKISGLNNNTNNNIDEIKGLFNNSKSRCEEVSKDGSKQICDKNSSEYNDEDCKRVKDIISDCETTVINSQEAGSSKNFFEQFTSDSVKLKIVESSENPNKYCFTTQSFCPYDFNILGGTEKKGTDFNDSNQCRLNKETEVYECEAIFNENCSSNSGTESLDCHNQPSNFCQLDRHCMMLKPYPDVEVETPEYPYLDKSCINNVGSSHNNDYFASYNSYARKISLKTHLTAPVVECIVETSKNLLFNRAGFTSCKDESEIPTENEVCYSGYKFKRGEDITEYGYTNFLEKTRKRLSKIIKILLVFAVIMYGFNLVVFGKGFKREDFVKFFIKIVLVIALSLNTNWTKIVLDGVYKVSGAIINFVYNTLQIEDWQPSYDNPKFDGCYFSFNKDFNNNYNAYPSGRKYIAFFDYVDCKFQKYMGFDAGSIDIINVIILFVLTGILTLILVLPLLMIFIILISVVVKISYIFVIAMLTLTILLFLTPIIVPLSLFERTKKIFDNWLKKVLGFIFYPMFLIVAITILFFIYDEFFINEAIYFGKDNAPYRTIYCGRICKVGNEHVIINSNASDIDAEDNCEMKLGGELIDLMKYPICIYKANEKVSDRSIDFISFFVGLRFPIIKISTSLYKFLFTNYAILFIILLFIEMTLDGIVGIGSVIFGASVDGSEANNLRFTNVMGKMFGWAVDNTSRTINTGVGLVEKGLYESRERRDSNNSLNNNDNDKTNTMNAGVIENE